MTLARTHAVALVGVQGHPVEIEADIENGLVALLLVGLPDTALREARDRIRAAIVNSGEAWPQRRITVGLSPASLPKRGSWFDLGIAAAILAAARVSRLIGSAAWCCSASSAWTGGYGRSPACCRRWRRRRGRVRRVAVAAENVPEAALVPQMRVLSVPSLAALVAWLREEPLQSGLPCELAGSGTRRAEGRRPPLAG